MIGTLRGINLWARHHAGKLLLVGLAGVAWHNWQLWQRDREFADRIVKERPPVPTLSRTPKVSVLVAAWNEADMIDAHIQSFLALDYPDLELILCAGGDDGTLQQARRYEGERVVVLEQLQGEGKQRALARCFERAQGEVLYFTDADCVFRDDALVYLMAALTEEGEEVACGGSRPLDSQMDEILPLYIWSADVASSARWPRYVDGVLGRNVAVTRRAVEASGGLDFHAPTGTDYHLSKRLLKSGFRLRYQSMSMVPSKYAETFGIHQRKQSRWLRNLILYGRGYGAKRDLLVATRTLATGLVMIVWPVLALPLGRNVMVPWFLLLAQALGAKVRHVLFASRLDGRPAPRRLLAALLPLTLLDFAVWAAPIIDLLHPRRRKRW